MAEWLGPIVEEYNAATGQHVHVSATLVATQTDQSGRVHVCMHLHVGSDVTSGRNNRA